MKDCNCALVSAIYFKVWSIAHDIFGGILTFVAVLASSMKLRYPMTDVLPNIEHARDSLLAKMFRYRKSNDQDGVSDEDFALLYAYGA